MPRPLHVDQSESPIGNLPRRIWINRARRLEERHARLREALHIIEQHARLDLAERGVREAERYAVIAADALSKDRPA